MVLYKQNLNFDYYLKLLDILVWPLTIILVLYFFRNETRKFIERMTGAELPGGVKLTAEQKQSDIGEEKNHHGEGEQEEFRFLDSFLVKNSKAALKWFYDKKVWTIFDVFNDLFILPVTPQGIDIPRERLVIFAILIQLNLLESKTENLFKISTKGIQFLKFIKYI